MQGGFSKQKLFNASEFKVYRLLVDEVSKLESRYFVMGQTSMREFLNTDSKFKKGGSFYALSDRRMDFVIIDDDANVVLAIEYQGSGHYQGNAQERDEVKALALGKAGIPLMIIADDTAEDKIRSELRLSLCARTKADVLAFEHAP